MALLLSAANRPIQSGQGIDPVLQSHLDLEEWSVLKNEGEKQNLSELTTIVLPAQQNFKGYLKVYGQDYSGNVGEIVKSKGMVSEDEQLHEQVSKISLKIPEAVFTDEKEKLNYYNKAVFVEATSSKAQHP